MARCERAHISREASRPLHFPCPLWAAKKREAEQGQAENWGLTIWVACWIGVSPIHGLPIMVAAAMAGGIAKVDEQAGGRGPGQVQRFLRHRSIAPLLQSTALARAAVTATTIQYPTSRKAAARLTVTLRPLVTSSHWTRQ
jgi:hypothetical protein